MNRLRVLWLSHFVPFPPRGGCFQRNYHLIRRVGAEHELHLIALRHKRSTHPDWDLAQAREALRQVCATVEIVDISRATTPAALIRRGLAGLVPGVPLSVGLYRSRAVRQAIRASLARVRPDVVHFDTIGLAQYLDEVHGAATTLTHHGAESHMIERRIRHEASLARRWFFRFEAAALRRYEARMCSRFGINIVMSDHDAGILRAIAPDATFEIVPNGTDVEYFQPVSPMLAERRIVFAGRLDQHSNRDGILHFLHETWPLIRRRYPDACFHVIGNNPPAALREAAATDKNIHVWGFVPDVRPFFRDAMVAICPVRNGGGTRIKILDALAQGVPLVTTTIGCEGLAVTHGQNVLIADTPEAFAREVGRVFDDPELRARLSANGRALVEARYSWNALAQILTAAYRRLVSGTPVASSPREAYV